MTANQTHFDVGGVVFPRPFCIVRLGHLGLWRADVDESRRKIIDLLGFRHTDHLVGREGESLGCFTTCNTDHHALVAISTATADGARKEYLERGVTLNQMSFQVNSLREVNDAHRFFVERGVPISRIGRDLPGSNWAVYAFDPDGHRVELFYGMEQIGWNGVSKPEAMYERLPHTEFPLPQQAEAVEVSTARDNGIDLLSGFGRESDLPYAYDVGGVLMQRPFRVANVGPVRIFVADLEASERFYTEIIGLRKTQEVSYEGHRCVFLRAGSEHHSVALIPVALRETLPVAQNTTLLSFGLQVQTYAQLKDAREFLRAQGLREIRLPAALHPGIEFAAHFMLDETHCIQLYFEMGQVAPVPRASATAEGVWPDQLEATPSTYATQLRQGPLA